MIYICIYIYKRRFTPTTAVAGSSTARRRCAPQPRHTSWRIYIYIYNCLNKYIYIHTHTRAHIRHTQLQILKTKFKRTHTRTHLYTHTHTSDTLYGNLSLYMFIYRYNDGISTPNTAVHTTVETFNLFNVLRYVR